jgi:DNA-binding response OmpR family regulator
MANPYVVIAEDDPVLCNLYVKKFSTTGYRLKTAMNGEEAVHLISQEPPDLFICDINMPKLDGFQVLERFPKATRSFPVILLTNFEDEMYKKRGAELGADDYFVKKNMTLRTLLDMVERLLREKGKL